MVARLDNGELILYGVVGADWFWEDGFTADDVIYALAAHGRDNDLTVRINSPGGIAAQGIAIHSALKAHEGKVRIVVDGQALSAASVIAMAGDERIMRTGSFMMVHDARGDFFGMTEEDMDSAVNQLRVVSDSIANIYASVTGEDREIIRSQMKSELWMSAEEAVERGFATAANDDPALDPPAYSYEQDYQNPPERLVALARDKNWRRPSSAVARSATPAVAQPSAKEKSVADKTPENGAEVKAVDETAIRNEAAKAERARISAISSHSASARFPKLVARLIESGATAEEATAQLDAIAEDLPEQAQETPEVENAATEAYAQQRITAAGAPSAPAKAKAKAELNISAIYASRRAG